MEPLIELLQKQGKWLERLEDVQLKQPPQGYGISTDTFDR
jgi:hypothetical protein